MRQEYYTILPIDDKALSRIDRFGSESLRYETFDEAVEHYDEFKRLQIPGIGVAKVICINGQDLLKERNKGENDNEENH